MVPTSHSAFWCHLLPRRTCTLPSKWNKKLDSIDRTFFHRPIVKFRRFAHCRPFRQWTGSDRGQTGIRQVCRYAVSWDARCSDTCLTRQGTKPCRAGTPLKNCLCGEDPGVTSDPWQIPSLRLPILSATNTSILRAEGSLYG